MGRGQQARATAQMLSILNKRFSGLAEQVEMRHAATPVTWARYTGNWRGSYEGWLIRVDTFGMRMIKTLRGLENFYMAGQWVSQEVA